MIPKSVAAIPTALTIAHVLSGVDRSSAAGRTPATAVARKNHTDEPKRNTGRSTSNAKVSISNNRCDSASVNQNGPAIEKPQALEAGSPSPQTIEASTNVVGKKSSVTTRIAIRVLPRRAEIAIPNATATASHISSQT